MTDIRDLKANAEGLLAVGLVERAIQVIETGLATAPDDPDLLFLLVRARLKLGLVALAIETAERLLAVAPDSARSNWIYALSICAAWQFRPGKIRELAIPAATEARRLEPSAAEVHYDYAYCRVLSVWPLWLDRDALADARGAALEAASLAPGWVAPLLLLADIEKVAWNRKQAAGYAEKALRMDPTDSEVLLSAIDTASASTRRLLARRLAAIHPSHVATDLVLRTHRPIPRWSQLIGVAVIGYSASISDSVSFGELQPGPAYLWVLGPLTGMWLAALGLGWRRRSLKGFDPEVKGVVFDAERRFRWIRLAIFTWLLILPALWWPASIIGRHPTAWAVAWLFSGAVAVLATRLRFGF